MQKHILHAHDSVFVYLLAVANPYLLDLVWQDQIHQQHCHNQ